MTIATMENVEIGTEVLVKVGSGSVLRPGIVEGFGTRSAYRGAPKKPAVKVGFIWANGRVTHGRVFGIVVNEAAILFPDHAQVFVSPEPHPAAIVEALTNPAVA
jgi:hypothetical protein